MSITPTPPRQSNWLLPSSGGRPSPGLDHEEGRIARSSRLLGAAWGFLRERPRMIVLPALGAACTAVATAAIFLPVLFATRHLGGRLPVLVASAACAVPTGIIATYFNVAFLIAVHGELRGEGMTLRAALRAATRRWRGILGWALLSSLVGLAFRALEELPGGGWLGRIAWFLGDLAWALATFFVVPVLVLSEERPTRAVRRSAEVFRSTWGETVSADVGVGGVLTFVVVPLFILGFAGAGAWPLHPVTAGLLLGIAVLGIAAAGAIASTITELFVYALYREATEGTRIGLDTGAPLAEALVPIRRAWWRR